MGAARRHLQLSRRTALRLTGAALACAGAVHLALGAAPPLRAAIGQHLLSAAWVAAREAGAPHRPWGWADIAAVAHLTVPRLGVEAVVLGAASGEAMAWGPGHVAGTAPLGGPGLAAIAGHRDTHLAFLARLAPGDRLVLETAGGAALTYEVAAARVVDARTWQFPRRLTGPGVLALATCWPFGATAESPHRFVLFAEEIAPDRPGA